MRVIALIFREGYSPSSGDRLLRVELCEEAIRLGRFLVELAPDEGEAVGLLALLLMQHSRRSTRTDSVGDMVLLADQDRSQWDHASISAGAALTLRALRRGRGRYALQAALAACHATAPSATVVDWVTIVGLYDELALIDASPAIALNRAIAVAEIDGAEAGLALLNELVATEAGAALARTSHHVAAARAELHRRVGQHNDARISYSEAVKLSPTQPEHRFYERRLASLASTGRAPRRSADTAGRLDRSIR